jgi:hypothetical protein
MTGTDQGSVARLLEDAAQWAKFAAWHATRSEPYEDVVIRSQAIAVDCVLNALEALGMRVQGRPTMQQLLEKLDDDPRRFRVIISML